MTSALFLVSMPQEKGAVTLKSVVPQLSGESCHCELWYKRLSEVAARKAKSAAYPVQEKTRGVERGEFGACAALDLLLDKQKSLMRLRANTSAVAARGNSQSAANMEKYKRLIRLRANKSVVAASRSTVVVEHSEFGACACLKTAS